MEPGTSLLVLEHTYIDLNTDTLKIRRQKWKSCLLDMKAKNHLLCYAVMPMHVWNVRCLMLDVFNHFHTLRALVLTTINQIRQVFHYE